LNPDLSPEWTKKFLAANGALQTVERGIQDRMRDYGVEGFCLMYGILIPQVWEQSMTQLGRAPVSWPRTNTSPRRDDAFSRGQRTFQGQRCPSSHARNNLCAAAVAADNAPARGLVGFSLRSPCSLLLAQ
jgi:hypothetical protein